MIEDQRFSFFPFFLPDDRLSGRAAALTLAAAVEQIDCSDLIHSHGCGRLHSKRPDRQPALQHLCTSTQQLLPENFFFSVNCNLQCGILLGVISVLSSCFFFPPNQPSPSLLLPNAELSGEPKC